MFRRTGKNAPLEQTTLTCLGQGRTHQSEAAAADINNILRNWRKTGTFSSYKAGTPWYGDFTNATDYLDATLKIGQAKEAFFKLPSAVRSACDNNPATFLQKINDTDSLAALEALGLPVEHPSTPPTPSAPPPPVAAEAPAGGVIDPPPAGGETP